MVSLRRWTSTRGIALVVLVAVTLAAIIVVIDDAVSAPGDGSAPAPPAPARASQALPRTGHVIGVMAVPATWQTLRLPQLPFTMGYPPGWRVQRLSANGTPGVVLVDATRARTLAISGRRVRAGAQAQRALAALAVTPVPQTLDPRIFIRSYPYVPRRSQVTTVVALEQAGYLWTARLVQPQDAHLADGLRALQGMLATFTGRR